MAEVVLGLGTSHGPMLSTQPERWGLRVNADRNNKQLFFRGGVYDFDGLTRERADEDLAAQISLEVQHQRFAACQQAIGELADAFERARPDVAVIVGNDQMEMFWSGLLPSFSVFYGDAIENRQPPAEVVAGWEDGLADSISANAPDEPVDYPGQPELALHILDSLQADGFDLTSLKTVPPHREGWTTIPHAYGFVFRKIMRDKAPPTVPIVQNTFYPPNQPPARRCIELGRALGRALLSWQSDKKVALIASGGLTHFVVDEKVDRLVLDAFAANDPERVAELDESVFQAGTSEVKNWLPVGSAMAELGFKMKLVDYVPCYRSTAGTGSGMAFVTWQPPGD